MLSRVPHTQSPFFDGRLSLRLPLFIEVGLEGVLQGLAHLLAVLLECGPLQASGHRPRAVRDIAVPSPVAK